MLRLAAPTLRALAPAVSDIPAVLYLGLPEPAGSEASWLSRFAEYLGVRAQLTLDKAASRVFPLGRAAALVALENAIAALAVDSSRPILVGGVDTFFDLRLLATLGQEGRVLGPRVMDGFVPGEGAAFLLLDAERTKPASNTARILAAASTMDPGHRYGTEPARGEGLAMALELLRDRLSDPIGPIHVTFAGFNGENFDAKLWGVAQMRHGDLFSPEMTLEHPADCFGDTGAATGAVLMAMAAAAVSAGKPAGPALVWAASDRGMRACSVLTASAV
jgi:3-oxoacyl-[acyl-carrier-protein] synthase-1